MTVYEGVPSIGTFIAMKLANRVSKSRRKEASQPMNRTRTWVQSIVKLMAHLAGFSLLTWAGFTWNMTAGLIVAGISCFVFAWLMNDPSVETDTTSTTHVDPMASRR
jgi:hypothetical protein